MSFFENTQIREYSYKADHLLRLALETARNRDCAKHVAKSLLQRQSCKHLLAVHHQARVVWGQAIANQLDTYFCLPGTKNHNQPMFLVTLCDIACATSVDNAKPNISEYKTQLGSGLRGLSYLGALEPAYYTNMQKGTRIRRRRCVFWHVHALVWGISPDELAQHVANLEASGKCRAIVETVPGAHSREIKQGELAKTAGYIFKPPANAYRLSRRQFKRGDIVGHYFIQGKSPLRPGERVRLFLMMNDLCLDELALAGGGGVGLLKSAKKAVSKLGHS